MVLLSKIQGLSFRAFRLAQIYILVSLFAQIRRNIANCYLNPQKFKTLYTKIYRRYPDFCSDEGY